MKEIYHTTGTRERKKLKIKLDFYPNNPYIMGRRDNEREFMHELSRRGFIHSPQIVSEFKHNKKVEAVTHELIKLARIVEVPDYTFVEKVFGDRSVKDMIVAGIIPNV